MTTANLKYPFNEVPNPLGETQQDDSGMRDKDYAPNLGAFGKLLADVNTKAPTVDLHLFSDLGVPVVPGVSPLASAFPKELVLDKSTFGTNSPSGNMQTGVKEMFTAIGQVVPEGPAKNVLIDRLAKLAEDCANQQAKMILLSNNLRGGTKGVTQGPTLRESEFSAMGVKERAAWFIANPRGTVVSG